VTNPIVPPFDSDNLKQCTKCGEWKLRTEFYTKKRRKDGLDCWCKACARQASRSYYAANRDRVREYTAANYDRILSYKRQYNDTNRESIREKARKYREENREKLKARSRAFASAHPDKRREYHLRYRAAHPDKLRERYRVYRATNTHKVREYNLAYRANNPGLYLAAAQRRRARMSSLPDTFTAADWQAALDHFSSCCAVCGRPPGLWHTLAADHWIPLSSPDCPGTVPWNIVPLCHGVGGCNNSKFNRNPAEWLAERFGKRKAAAIQRRIGGWLDFQRT